MELGMVWDSGTYLDCSGTAGQRDRMTTGSNVHHVIEREEVPAVFWLSNFFERIFPGWRKIPGYSHRVDTATAAVYRKKSGSQPYLLTRQ